MRPKCHRQATYHLKGVTFIVKPKTLELMPHACTQARETHTQGSTRVRHIRKHIPAHAHTLTINSVL